MKTHIRFSLALLTLALGSAHAQPTGGAVTTPASNPSGIPATAADSAWQKLSGLQNAQTTPPTIPDARVLAGTSVPEQRTQLLAGLIATAQEAKSFYTKYPTDSRAKEARKIEAFATLQGAQHGDMPHLIDALVLGDAFRADKSNSAHDRFDIALAQETLNLRSPLHGQRLIDNGILAEQVGDRLYKEFGGTPEVAGFYLGVLRTADRDTAIRVARKIQSLNLSKDVQAEATLVEARYTRVGKSVEELVMESTDGERIDFAAIKNTAVVYFWDPAGGTDDLKLLARFKSAAPANTRWIYIGLGAAPKKLQEVKDAVPFSGPLCFDASALGSAAAAALCIRQTPAIAVIANGALLGFGDLEKLSSILTTVKP